MKDGSFSFGFLVAFAWLQTGIRDLSVLPHFTWKGRYVLRTVLGAVGNKLILRQVGNVPGSGGKDPLMLILKAGAFV